MEGKHEEKTRKKYDIHHKPKPDRWPRAIWFPNMVRRLVKLF